MLCQYAMRGVGKGATAPCPPSRAQRESWARYRFAHALANSAQRTLQIKTRVPRLLRRDRTTGPKQPAAKHVIAGPVDRLDAEQPVAPVAERRERRLRAVAAHHDSVIAGGEAGHLQLVGALVAPEPRQTVIDLGLAGQPRRHAARMVGGVLHRFQPQRTAKPLAGVERA